MSRLANYMRAGESVLLVGPPGVGKTARIFAAAEETGRKVIIMRASLMERVDITGALVPDVKTGVTKTLPLESIKKLMETEEPHLLFLDDLGQGPMDVQAPFMSLFDSSVLSKNVLIWGATNRPSDRASVSGLCEPLRSRFSMAFAILPPNATVEEGSPACLQTPQEELKNWVEWAISAGAPAEIVAWHRSTGGRTLYQWKPVADPAVRMADYRTWDTAIRMHKKGINDLKTMCAILGPSVAHEYHSFCEMATKIPSVDVIFKDPKGTPVPKDSGALYLVSSAIALAVDENNIVPFFDFADRLPNIYKALAVRDAYLRQRLAFSVHPRFNQWFIENQDILKG